MSAGNNAARPEQRPFYSQWEAASAVTRSPRHNAFDPVARLTPPQDHAMKAWAKRWLLRWDHVGGRAVIDTARKLQLDHRPPLHMSARHRNETAPPLADALLGELRGTVGGRRAVTAAVAVSQAHAAAACRKYPEIVLKVAAEQWLDAFREAGGGWLVVDITPHISIVPGENEATLRAMRDALFADERLAKHVRYLILQEWWAADALPASEAEGC